MTKERLKFLAKKPNEMQKNKITKDKAIELQREAKQQNQTKEQQGRTGRG